MKRFFIIMIIFIAFLLSGCLSSDLNENKVNKNIFDIQKTYYLRQMPVEFTTIYNVWKHLPINLGEYPDLKSMREDKYFQARKRFTINNARFIVKDIPNKKTYYLEENLTDDNPDKLYNYIIKDDKDILLKITQKDRLDIFTYNVFYKDKILKITCDVIKTGNNIQSFNYTVKDNDIILAYINKQFKYFINEYEIIINRNYREIADYNYIIFGIMLDQILKENGYRLKGQL